MPSHILFYVCVCVAVAVCVRITCIRVLYKNGNKLWKNHYFGEKERKTNDVNGKHKNNGSGSIIKREVKRQFFIFHSFTAFLFVCVCVCLAFDGVITRKIIILPNKHDSTVLHWNTCNFNSIARVVLCFCYVISFSFLFLFFFIQFRKIKHSW